MRILIIAVMMLSPSVALSNPSPEAELEKAVSEMSMPRFEARMKARAAIAKLVVKTVERYGFSPKAGVDTDKTVAPIIVAERTR